MNAKANRIALTNCIWVVIRQWNSIGACIHLNITQTNKRNIATPETAQLAGWATLQLVVALFKYETKL